MSEININGAAVDGETSENTPTPTKDFGHLFKSPTAWREVHLRDIAKAAEAEMPELLADEETRPILSAAQLRENLVKLAPYVRGTLNEVELCNTNYRVLSFNGEDERKGPRVEVAPIFAHFALTALDLLEAEQGTTVKPELTVALVGSDSGHEGDEMDPNRYAADLAIIRGDNAEERFMVGDTPGWMGRAAQDLAELVLNGHENQWRDVSNPEDIVAQLAALRVLQGVIKELADHVRWNADRVSKFHRDALAQIAAMQTPTGS